MSFFCVSCQVTRALISRSTRSSTDQLNRHFVSVTPLASSSRSSNAFSKRKIFNCSSRAEVVSKWKLFRGENVSRFGLSTDWNRAFCTKPKSEVGGLGMKLDKEEEEDDEFLRRLTTTSIDSSSNDLEDSLTEEERQILRELEEEERRFREKYPSGIPPEEDYYVWDGDFNESVSSKLASSVAEGHKPFQNQQRIIQDVIEEMWNPLPRQVEEEEETPYFPRGKTGVFDLGELVDLLREENADEVVVITLPKEIDYADYMVIVTVNNKKHLVGLATFVRKRFKMKDLKPTDGLPFLDKSVNHQGWIALDLGNIILQIFLQDMRDYYDLETLWTVGPLFDDLTNAPDAEIVQLLNTIK